MLSFLTTTGSNWAGLLSLIVLLTSLVDAVVLNAGTSGKALPALREFTERSNELMTT